MPRVELAPEVLDDFARFLDYMARFKSENGPQRISQIVDALELLTRSPLVCRPLQNGKRELVIGRASHGYVALYRYEEDEDVVFVLAIRSQRERGYERDI